MKLTEKQAFKIIDCLISYFGLQDNTREDYADFDKTKFKKLCLK